ncbi:MAG: type III PLP-dependent enzyme [Gammaproteobacteria bacterium]
MTDQAELKLLTPQCDWQSLVHRHGSPLLVLDCDVLRRQYRQLSSALPGVDLYFAIKALPHDIVLATLHREGCNFDLATQGEIRLLEKHSIPPKRTIHTHPIKRDVDIRAALRYGCTTFVVDNETELRKFIRYRERVGLLLRLSFPNPDALINLSKKFGLPAPEAQDFLAKAAELGIHIKGISFHVGSQCRTPDAHIRAIDECAELIQASRKTRDIPMRMLDIGGGFPTSYDGAGLPIDEFCTPIRKRLEQLPENIHVIAEPGRFIAAPSMVCITSVIGKAKRGDRIWYYLDDGVYGSFSGQIFDHVHYPLFALRDGPRQPCVLAGPTCDSIDVIAEDILMPELELGDLIIAPMMGAYTSATATEFNSLPRTHIIAINTDAHAEDSVTKIA